MNTEKLVYQCLQKNDAAQRELYEKFSTTVMKICQRYCHANQLAQDAFQDACIIIFNQLSQWDKNRGSFEGWCYRIAVNAALMQLRKEKKFAFSEIENEPMEDNFFLDINDSLAYDDLKQILDRLPNGQRIVFNLYAIEGYAHKEIAKLLKINEGTSKSQLAKARTNLKQLYKEYFIEVE